MITVADYEEYALQYLNKATRDYYKSGANAEDTLRENLKAFRRLKIRPRFLTRDVSKRNLTTTFLGSPVSFPVGVSPTAMQRMAHPDGELATARACEAAGTVMILSTISTSSIEEVAEAAPKATKWFQLYIYKDRDVTKKLIKRAEDAGFKALVVTVDTPFFGTRLADARNKFYLPANLTLANFKSENLPNMGTPTDASGSGLNEYANSLFDASLTWKDISWLTKTTRLPVVVKGILTADDALLAVEHGSAGVIVSNHGARQLDGVAATIEALPEVVRAVRGRCEIYVDGGFRVGTDVLKALSLGARGVFVGRPVLWGLSHKGEEGVKQVLQIIKREFDVAMALSGCAELKDINRELVVHRDYYISKL